MELYMTARKLLMLGYSVIPSGGGKSGKAPIVNWTEYQNRLPTEEELLRWQHDLNPPLWGIVTGEISGIVVFDVDGQVPKSLFDEAGLKPHVATRRGYHYYFKHPGHLLKNKTGIIPHLDMRGDGGFVNCIGNIESAQYAISIFPARESLYNLTQLPERTKQALITQPMTTHDSITEPIPEGQRNTTLASLAGSLKHRGLPQRVIEISLLAVNSQVCRPPLTSEEVLKIAKSIGELSSKKRRHMVGRLQGKRDGKDNFREDITDRIYR